MKKNKENILITGGSGFIGSHLIRELLNHNYCITVLSIDILENSKIFDLKEKIDFIKLDLKEEEKLKKIIKKTQPNIIIHLAANSNRKRDPEIIDILMEDNFKTTLNLYKSAQEIKDLKLIVTLGSAEEYGQNKTPFSEDQKEMPVSPYSVSKICVTYLSKYFYQIHKLPITIFRPSVVYGEDQTGNQFIPFTIKKCLKNECIDMTLGEQTRDFIYVKDLVKSIIIAIQEPKRTIGKILNVCIAKQKTIKEVAILIKKLTDSKSVINFGALKYRKGENMDFYGSNSKIKELLNWAPEYSFEEGLKKTIEWYKKEKI